MAQTGLLGPYPLTEEAIQKFVTDAKDWSSASVYALGPVREKHFYIRRVGHAEGNLAEVLKKYLGQYVAFRFKFFRSTRTAYNKECYLYHDFKPKDNEEHPVKPKNTKFTCPVASCELSG